MPEQAQAPVPFNDIAKNFDPMMPAEDYDAMRNHYFYNVVAPTVDRTKFPQLEPLRQQFFKGTERPPLLGPVDRALLQTGVGAINFAKETIAPAAGLIQPAKDAYDKLDAKEQAMEKVARREGMDTTAAKGVGSFLGQAGPLVAAYAATGPMAAALTLPKAAEAGRLALFANRVVHGGLAFAAIQAAREGEGNRVIGGLQGFGEGAAFETALGLFSLPKYLRSSLPAGIDADAVARDLAQGKPMPANVDQKAADYVKNQVEVARAEARPSAITQDAGKRGVFANVLDKAGNPTEIEVKPLEERAAVNQISKVVDAGGSFQGATYHPDDKSRFISFMNELRSKSAQKYDYTKRVVTESPEEVAQRLRAGGVPAEATGEADITVHGLPAKEPLPKDVEYIGKQDTGAGDGSFFETYNLKLGNGQKATFTVKPGQSIRDKADVVRQRYATLAMPTMPKDRAIQIVKQMGGDPEKADLSAIMQMKPEQIDAILKPIKAKQDYERLGKEIEQLNIKAQQGGEGVADIALKLGDLYAQRDELFKQLPGSPEIKELSKWAESYNDEVADKTRQTGVQNPGLLEEKIRKGEVKRNFQGRFGPSSEQPGALQNLEVTVPSDKFVESSSSRPFRNAIVTGAGKAKEAFGFSGVEYDTTENMMKSFGKELPPGFTRGNIPAIIVEKGAPRNEIWHENMHVGIDHLGYDFQQGLRKMVNEGKNTVLDLVPIAQEMKNRGYEGYTFNRLLNEAYTYSAEAVRHGNADLLSNLGAWNNGEKAVVDAVHGMSKELLQQVYGKVDSVPMRIMQRKLNDLIARSSPNVTHELINAGMGLIDDAHWDGERWAVRDSANTVSHYKNLSDVFDGLEEKAKGTDMAPGLSFYSELMGVRGPIKDGGPPSKLPMPIDPVDSDWKNLGWQALSGIFRPLLPWAASADKAVNNLLKARGEYIPLYDTVRAVDNMYATAKPWYARWKETFGDTLSKVSQEKQHDIFELMTSSQMKTAIGPGGETVYASQGWPQATLDRLKITPQEEAVARQFQLQMRKFQDETKIPIFEYFTRFFPKLRANNWAVDAVPGWTQQARSGEGFWESAVKNNTSSFDPTDTHAGKFTNWLLQQGIEKMYTGKPLNQLESIINKKSANGKYILGPVRWPLYNYARYMRGIPDPSQQIMNSAVGTFLKALGAKSKEMNVHLPDGMKLPEEYSAPQAMIAKWTALSYAAGIGMRPALVVRDLMAAPLTSLPVLGPGKFFSGMAKALTKEGWAAAEQAGALMDKHNVSEMYGDVFNEISPDMSKSKLMQAADTMMQPARWGNNVARAITYHGEYDSALPAIDALRAGKMTQEEFLNTTSLGAHDEANISRIMGKIFKENDVPTTSTTAASFNKATGKASSIITGQVAPGYKYPSQQLAKELALDTVDLLQWPYRRGTQPAFLRTGMGRLFGQYGTWPLNYIDFVARMSQKMGQPALRTNAVRTAATWVAVNYAASHVMEGIGIDTSNWLWGAPTVYTGGPMLELTQDLMKSMGDSQDSREARKNLLTSPKYFVPGYVELTNIIKAINDNEDPTGKGLLRVLGFKPIEHLEKDRDVQEWLKYQVGLPQR